MKKHLVALMISGWFVAGLCGRAAAEQKMATEQFRAAYGAVLTELSNLPVMTFDWPFDPSLDAEMQRQQESLLTARSDARRDLELAHQALATATAAELDALQAQLSSLNWQELPHALQSNLTAPQLANLAYPNHCFGDIFAAGIARFSALAVRAIATKICDANQCSGAAGSVTACVINGVARTVELAAVIAQQQIMRCHSKDFENETERRLGVTVTSRATVDSVGIRNDCDTGAGKCARTLTTCTTNQDCVTFINNCVSGHCARTGVECSADIDCGPASSVNGEFAAMNLHDKLQTRLDVQTSTRSTQDSVDGQRSAPVIPSDSKSVRTVVDKTDEIVLPRLQKKMDKLNAAIAAQGSLLRDLQALQIRFKISENLIQRHPRVLPVALFQVPNTVSAPPKKFCSISNTRSCSVNADCPPAVVGETCDGSPGMRVCSMSGSPCTDIFDCPVQPQAAETCVTQPTGQMGLLQSAREIVQETIDMTDAAAQQVGGSQVRTTRAVVDINAANFKQSYRHLRQSYRKAIKPYPVNP